MENLANRKMTFKENQATILAQERASKLELKKLEVLQRRRDRQMASLQQQYRRHQKITESDNATEKKKGESAMALSVLENKMNQVETELDAAWKKR